MARGDDRTSIQDLKIQIRRKDGKIFGPYSRREILGFIFAKKLDGSESILFEGSDRWRPINSDNEFFDALQEVLFGVKPSATKRPDPRTQTKGETIIGGEPTRARREDLNDATRVSEPTRVSDQSGESTRVSDQRGYVGFSARKNQIRNAHRQ